MTPYLEPLGIGLLSFVFILCVIYCCVSVVTGEVTERQGDVIMRLSFIASLGIFLITAF